MLSLDQSGQLIENRRHVTRLCGLRNTDKGCTHAVLAKALQESLSKKARTRDQLGLARWAQAWGTRNAATRAALDAQDADDTIAFPDIGNRCRGGPLSQKRAEFSVWLRVVLLDRVGANGPYETEVLELWARELDHADAGVGEELEHWGHRTLIARESAHFSILVQQTVR